MKLLCCVLRCATFVMEEDTPASKVSVSTSACADQSQLWQEMEPQTPLLVDAQVHDIHVYVEVHVHVHSPLAKKARRGKKER